MWDLSSGFKIRTKFKIIFSLAFRYRGLLLLLKSHWNFGKFTNVYGYTHGMDMFILVFTRLL